MPDTNDNISYRIDEAVKVGGHRLIMRRDLLEFIDGGNSLKPPVPPALATKADANGLPQWTQLELPLRKRR